MMTCTNAHAHTYPGRHAEADPGVALGGLHVVLEDGHGCPEDQAKANGHGLLHWPELQLHRAHVALLAGCGRQLHEHKVCEEGE